MACFSDDAKIFLKTWNREPLCEAIEADHAKLLERRVEFVEYGDPEKVTDKERARANCKLLSQSLLHRAERLIKSSGSALVGQDPYALALLARGHVEATAVLGYFCHRVRSLARGTITFEQFHQVLQDSVAGGKHDLFAKKGAPKNIITMIENADKFVDTEIPQAKKSILKEAYSWLSEFAHPNFLSHSNAFKLDKSTHRMVFRHDKKLEADDFQHLLFLSISASLFLAIYHVFNAQAEAALAD